MVDEDAIVAKFQMLAGQLDERGLRLWAAAEARACGWGGTSAVSRATWHRALDDQPRARGA